MSEERDSRENDIVRAQLQLARTLLKARRYDEARQLLENVDHETARLWLYKLNTLVPDRTDDEYVDQSKKNLSEQQEPALASFLPFSDETPIIPDNNLDTTDAPTPSPPKGFGCKVIIIAILACAIIQAIFSGNSRNEVDTGRNISSSSIEILDPLDSGIANQYLEDLRAAVSQYGYIDFYEGIVMGGTALRVDAEIYLLPNYANPLYATRTLISALRSYASSLEPHQRIALTTRVYWSANQNQCAIGAGMGSQVMRTMDLEANEIRILAALEQGRFSDNTTSDSAIAFYNGPSNLPGCRN